MSDAATVTVAEAARVLGVTTGRVRQLLTARRIDGARKHGRDWVIPVPVIVLRGRGRSGGAR